MENPFRYTPIFLLVLFAAFGVQALLYQSVVFGAMAVLFLAVCVYTKTIILPPVYSKIQSKIEIKNPNLMACPDCEEAISKKASLCPHCGGILKTPENVIVGRVFWSIIVIFCLYASIAHLMR
ncbi:MAG: hypothetical protein LBS73_05060 [Campylobacteraceae bacterium]|jgi:RNA polymerase subunit RPABC4/transcription elongation factor Spt4|nr:hypothetical protein [Campylobacteraceae bacterium]